IEMKVVFGLRVRSIRSVEADNVVVLIFYPDTSGEPDSIVMRSGHHIKDHGADLAQELLANKLELVMVVVEPVIEKDGLHESQAAVIKPVEAIQTVQDPADEPGLVVVLKRLLIEPLMTEHQAAQEISVFIGQGPD